MWSDEYEWTTADVVSLVRCDRHDWNPNVEEPCLVHPVFNDDTYDEACEQYESRVYEPLKVPDLYQAFAQTEPTEDGVMAFISQYGILGERAFGKGIGVCEPLGVWRYEIMAVRRVLQLHELIEAPEEVQLGRFAGLTAMITKFHL